MPREADDDDDEPRVHSGRLTDHVGIGVLTRLINHDLVDDVLLHTGKREHRVRLLPARVVVYFVLALSLFFGDDYAEVMRRLTDGLRFQRTWGRDWTMPTTSALTQARARLGEQPLRELFERVAVPMATRSTPGAWLGGLRLMAIDGVMLDLEDTKDNEREFGRLTRGGDPCPFPQARVVGLVECGTHAMVAARIGGIATGERALAETLFDHLEPGMILIADRGFYSLDLWNAALATGAHLLWRVSGNLILPVLEVFPDGSYRSVLVTTEERRRLTYWAKKGEPVVPRGIDVRVIEYHVGDRDGEPVRLITSVMDHDEVFASDLAEAYHQRWEFELVLAELETRQRRAGVPLRSRSPEMVRQEIWGLLLTHYAIRDLMREAAAGVKEDQDPDRISFIRALRVVRRQVDSQAAFSPEPSGGGDESGD